MDDDLRALAELSADAVYTVWSAIGHDVIEASQYGDEPLTNVGAVETCLDADRMRGHQDPDVRAVGQLISEAIDKYGYPDVLYAVASTSPLV